MLYFTKICKRLLCLKDCYSTFFYIITVHSIPVTGKNPCKICFANGFLLACETFSHGLSSKCSTPFAFKKSFAWLKCLHPKNPLCADNGLGCAAFKIRCFGLVSIGILRCAGFPQSRYTIGLSCALTV